MNASNQVATLVIQKSELLQELKRVQIANILGISKSAVSQWREVIPELSAKKLLEVMPSLPHKYVKN